MTSLWHPMNGQSRSSLADAVFNPKSFSYLSSFSEMGELMSQTGFLRKLRIFFYFNTSYFYWSITLGFGLHFKRRPKLYPLKEEISTESAKSPCLMTCRMGCTMATSVIRSTRLNNVPCGHLSKLSNALVCAQ